jgi:hypothetical protein
MAHQDETEAPARPSLYDRLGGVYNIAPVVDDLIDRVMIDSNTSLPKCFARPLAGPSNTLVGRWETRTGTS